MASLAAFCHSAPDSLVGIALADFQATEWDGIPAAEEMTGATWVASRCGNVGREDLKAALIGVLLRRANPHDFPPRSAAFANVAWLLKQPEAVSSTFTSVFLNAVCTERWLGSQFTITDRGPLANGLRMLALFQPKVIRQRFQNPKLGLRLRNDFSRFFEASAQEQSQIIQLLGSSALFGLPSRKEWFNEVLLDIASRLPVNTLPHRADSDKVEYWQFQLWLGLRVLSQVMGKPLETPKAVLGTTLDLWRSNLAETSVKAESAEHFVNQSMVSWLESCLRDQPTRRTAGV